MQKKAVVILGAGFGGLRAAIDVARGLKRLSLLEKYEVVLVDRSDRHVFIPLLYKLAAGPGAERAENCSYDIASLVKGFPIRFVCDEVASFDLAAGGIRLVRGGDMRADFLVIALGSETNYFDIPGLDEHALELKSIASALAIRNAVQSAFAKGGEVRIVAGGGGPNGIEIAAELRLWANRAQKKNPRLRVKVTILEALPTILPGFDERAATIAGKRLHTLGITVMTGAKITAVSESEIAIENNAPVPFDIFVWTGGTKSPALLAQVPLEKEKRGRVMAQSGMQCTPGTPDLRLHPMVYGIGDNVCFYDPKTQKPVPAVAHVAILEGRIAARNLIEEIRASENLGYRPHLTAYVPRPYPYVIPVGEKWAVAKFGPIMLKGWLGSQFSRLVELNYLFTIMPPMRALKAWLRMRR